MIDQSELPGILFTLEEQQALVGRVTASELFRRSPRQRELLHFLADEQFANRAKEVTEQRIGQRVFGRAEGYNQSEDNIVRVSVRQLRMRIKSYFETEGQLEGWTIEIPKGGYHLEFHPRDGKTTERAAVSPIWLRTGDYARLAAVTCCAVCLFAGFWIGSSRRLSAATERDAPVVAEGTAVNDLFTGSKLINVVVADTGLLKLLAGRQVSLEEYTQVQFSASRPTDKTQDSLVTSLADVTFVSRVLRSPGLRDRVRVLHARNANPDDFSTDNAVILGGPRVNPWSEFFEEKLNFKVRYVGDAPGCFVNRKPLASEMSVYGRCETNEKDKYARIAWLPNLNHSGQVLIISGSGMLATENASDYLLAPGSASRLAALLGVRNLNDVGYFELILHTDSRAGVPSGNQVVAWRVGARSPGRLTGE